MTKRYLIILMTLVAAVSMQARETNQTDKPIKGYSGGMLIHTGYQSGCDNPFGYNPKGATFGIGGLVKLQLTNHFRVGAEGYFSTMGLMDNGSYNKLFWSGALCDWVWKCRKFYPYIGTMVGGGMETAYYMFGGSKSDWLPESNAVFHKQPFFALDPFIGVEYEVGKAFRLSLKADWMLAFNSQGLNRPMGPRIYFGFIFAH